VPIVLSSAAQRHRCALALAAGLVVAFTATGFIVAAFGQALGIDTLVVRAAGAVVLCVAGVVLLVPKLQDVLTRLATPLAAWASQRQSALDDRAGLWGQALVGALLGVVWAPCVGPTLGAAVALAAEGKDLGEVVARHGCLRPGYLDGAAGHRVRGARRARDGAAA
jgi:cytochrome c biogenesis protein CcdA